MVTNLLCDENVDTKIICVSTGLNANTNVTQIDNLDSLKEQNMYIKHEHSHLFTQTGHFVFSA